MHDGTPAHEPRRFRLGAFEFDRSTGELRHLSADGEDSITRLAPQPARLLSLLIEKRGELVGREEIRDRLWPDVHVEFDQGLHFCVRQIRTALGERANSPSYLETLPRRGYRLLVDAEPIDEPEDSAAHAQRSVKPWVFWSAGSVLVIVIAIIAVNSGMRDRPVRIAIMPFAPPDGVSAESDPTQIATHLVAELGDQSMLAVIGPTTTIQFTRAETPLSEVAAELDVQYIINGRFAERDGRTQLLAELIRTSDGAHVWVHWFDDLQTTSEIASVITTAVSARLLDSK